MSSTAAFSAPPRRLGAPVATSTAFSSFSSRRPTPATTAPPPVLIKKNTLASVIDNLLPTESESSSSKHREWSNSALKQRAAAAAAPAPAKKTFDEEFPSLGGGGSGGAHGGAGAAAPIPKSVGSFASLAASWAKTEEEHKIAEARAIRLRKEQQLRDEQERAERSRFYDNVNSNRRYGGYDEEYDEYPPSHYEDEYIEGELGEPEYPEKETTRSDTLTPEEDEDRADYNIGNRAW